MKTEISKCPNVIWAILWSMAITLATHYTWFHQPCNQPHATIEQLRNTFRAGAAVSELHHAETAHYPNDEWLNSVITAFEGGAWKQFLDDFIKGDSRTPEGTGSVFIAPEGEDSGKESERL